MVENKKELPELKVILEQVQEKLKLENEQAANVKAGRKEIFREITLCFMLPSSRGRRCML